MSSLVFKLKGPQRALEIEIPVAGNGAVSALKKVLADSEQKQIAAAQQKKHWWQRSNSSATNEKSSGASTALVLLTSMILSALDE